MDSPEPSKLRLLFQPAVLVGALGYFVDIYDLLLFQIVRAKSLASLGITSIEAGVQLYNWQMAGLLVGGVLWGVLGDRKGRTILLFGSIALYSGATLANAFVHSYSAYAFWRVLAGIGLAGELGGSMALISEILPREVRGYGTTIVATVGVFGAVVAGLTGKLFDWRVAYTVGGVLGFALLALRVGVAESAMFKRARAYDEVPRGDFLSLFTNFSRFRRYLCCILIGLPLWYAVGIVVAYCPEFARELGVRGEVTPGDGVLWAYFGLTVGDFLTGTLSQLLHSRKKVVALGMVVSAVFLGIYFSAYGVSSTVFYAIIFGMGIGLGYWAVFATMAAEQFGTNLRATTATTVPNFVRGSLIPISWLYLALKGSYSPAHAAALTGVCILPIAFLALLGLRETYGVDLDYVELPEGSHFR